MRLRAFLPVLFLASPVSAEDVLRVAAASNFADTAGTLLVAFQHQTGVEFRLTTGSTGKLYAQVVNGAPFDVFMSADAERPRLLEAGGYAVSGSRYTYARGRLIVWSSTADDCLGALYDMSAGKIALANPVTAPYGLAAKEFLIAVDAWDAAVGRIVYGQNVLQAIQFAATGNAPTAIIPRTHANHPAMPRATCTADIPASSHAPLEQQVVLISSDNEAARRFLEFLRSDTARYIIVEAGYEVSP